MNKDIGYLFKPELRDKIRRNLKWQTRRLRGLEAINECPEEWGLIRSSEDGYHTFFNKVTGDYHVVRSPFGTQGDRMYIKEPTRVVNVDKSDRVWIEWIDSGHASRVDVTEQDLEKLRARADLYKPSSAMFMLKSFARTKRSLVSVRPVILQDISEGDAIGEGIDFAEVCGEGIDLAEVCDDIHYRNYQSDASAFGDPISSFGSLWNSINKEHQWGDRSWWVWRIEWAKEVSE